MLNRKKKNNEHENNSLFLDKGLDSSTTKWEYEEDHQNV